MASKVLTLDDFYRSGGDWFGNPPIEPIESVTIDSRHCSNNSVFFALKGINQDGHDFILTALEKGATVIVYSKPEYDSVFKEKNRLGIRVADPLNYIQDLAKRVMRKIDFQVLGITGSNGKTTTKEMVAHVLSNKYHVHKTTGNMNNHLGVPLTIFDLDKSHNFFIVEMGMNHAGEIWTLCEIAMPNAGLITNVGTAHIEFFGTQDKIADAKGELFSYLRKKKGFLFVNADDPYLLKQIKKTSSASFYGISNSEASVKAFNITADDVSCFTFQWIDEKSGKTGTVKLQIPGLHQVYNALSAVAVGLRYGIQPNTICESLNSFKAHSNRMEIKKINNLTIVSDCYNANSDSMKAGLKTLSEMKTNRRKVSVLGDMFELGELSPSLHKEIGQLINQLNIDVVITIGEQTRFLNEAIKEKNINKFHFLTVDEALKWLDNNTKKDDIIYIKASRGMKLEHITQYLEAKFQSQ